MTSTYFAGRLFEGYEKRKLESNSNPTGTAIKIIVDITNTPSVAKNPSSLQPIRVSISFIQRSYT